MIITKKACGSSTGGSSTGAIGEAEDGTYTDGLFTDFSAITPTGTAVDRFNEVLKSLAPSPAPTLDQMSAADTGANSKLSFGTSNAIATYSNVDASAGNSIIDLNGSYSVSGYRRGAFNGNTTINGILNDTVAAASPTYPSNAFGDGNLGELRLEVNGVVVQIVDLTTFASGNTLNTNLSGFNLLAATSVQFDSGDPFDVFKYRTGTWSVHPNDQRNGFNFSRVNHFFNSANHYTNYVEWVNDPDGNTLLASNGVLDSLVMTGTKFLSGIEYHTGGSALYYVDLDNMHRNLYSTSNSAVSFNGSNCSAASQSLGNIVLESDQEIITNKTVTVSTSNRLLNGSIDIGVNAVHPLKSNLSNQQNQSIGGLLLDNTNLSNTELLERFCLENYRLISAGLAATNDYGSQSDVNSVGNTWDSTISIANTSVVGYLEGLLIYNGKAVYPLLGLDLGDFRRQDEGNANGPTNSPLGNPSYNIASGDRYFYRKFRNNTGAVKANFTFNILGTGAFTDIASGPNGQNLTFEIKFPTGALSSNTGWMDMYGDFATNQWADGDGARNATAGAGRSMGSTWGGTFGTKSVADDEWVVVRIGADELFTGNLSQITMAWI